MMRRRRQTLSLSVLLILVGASLGLVENFAANQNNSFLSKALERDALPVLGGLIVLLIVVQLIMFRLDNPPAPSRQWDPTRTPYPGLEPFDEEDASVFFGRDDAIGELVSRLHSERTERFVVVAGASGSGKSSLVHAGLIPRLQGRKWLILPVITPGANPIGSLASAFGCSEEYASQLRTKPHMITQLVSQIRRQKRRRYSCALLVVDQLEELYSLSSQREREMFLRLIEAALAADTKFSVIATLRIEFLHDFLDSPYAHLFGHPVALGAIASTDLTTVIEGPASLVDMKFAPGLVTRIVADTGTTDALPLLAYLLQELYFVVGSGKTATSEHYMRLGGVAGALSRQADSVVAELRDQASVESILAVLLRFVSTDGTHTTRRRVDLADFTVAERQIVDAFVNARLLVTDMINGSVVAEVAHEALFRNWALLRQEVQVRIEQLAQRAELERWTADWQHSNFKAEYLLSGERLQLAMQWLENLEDQAPSAIQKFIDQSKRRDLAVLHHISESIAEYVLANVGRLPDLALLLAISAISEFPPTALACRALLAALTFNNLNCVLEGHTDNVWRLAWSPNGQHIGTASLDGTARIWDVATGQCLSTLTGHTGPVEAIAWSPDSAHLATTSRDQHIRLWSTAGELVARLSRPTNVIRAVAWSPNGKMIASGSDELLRVWDAQSHKLINQFSGHEDSIFGLAFSPDGERLVTGSHDRTVRIWNVMSGKCLVLAGHENLVESVAWSPDGTRVASASTDQSARIWDAISGMQLQYIRGHTDSVWNVSWSPDGAWLATCSADRTARIWNSSNATETVALRGHAGQVFDITWSPDGERLATASADKTARIWRANAIGGEVVSLIGHAGPIRDIVILAPSDSRQGQELIATCGEDRTIRIWDTAGDQINVLKGHADSVLHIAWERMLFSCSSDRTIRNWENINNCATARFVVECDHFPETISVGVTGRLASGERDGTIRIWDAVDGSPIAPMSGHQQLVADLAWSPSGSFLASASDDRTARIWNMSTFQEIALMVGHDSWVDSVSWSPDEQLIVTGSADQTVRIWSVATGQQIAILLGHQDRVHSVAWSPDGTLIATGSYDSTVRVWDAHAYTEVGVVGVHRDKVTSVAWSTDGKRVLSASFDGTARIWNAELDLNDLKARARTRVFRSLTDDERRAHLLPVSDM
jgi:WD40 repeat protein